MGCQGLLTVDFENISGKLSRLCLHADTHAMKKILTSWANSLLGIRGNKIRIDKDHLPGLRAPKTLPAPRVPYPSPKTTAVSDVAAMYKRFKNKSPKPVRKVSNKGKGLDFR